MQQNTFLIIGSFLGLTAVALGAFGAHGLRNVLNEAQLNTFETGVRYQFYHAFALLFLSQINATKSISLITTSGWLMSAGVLLFSGSIYLLACREILGIAHWRWLGPITPIGGTLLIIGWGCLLWYAILINK